MNKAVRELLERKKEENRLKDEQKRLKEENKLLIKNKKEQKLINKEEKSSKVEKIEKKIIIKNIPEKVIKEKINIDEKIIIQDNYKELKKQSDLTEKFIKLADQLNIDDRYFPKTEKGMSTKAKEILEKLNKKIEKEEKKK